MRGVTCGEKDQDTEGTTTLQSSYDPLDYQWAHISWIFTITNTPFKTYHTHDHLFKIREEMGFSWYESICRWSL